MLVISGECYITVVSGVFCPIHWWSVYPHYGQYAPLLLCVAPWCSVCPHFVGGQWELCNLQLYIGRETICCRGKGGLVKMLWLLWLVYSDHTVQDLCDWLCIFCLWSCTQSSVFKHCTSTRFFFFYYNTVLRWLIRMTVQYLYLACITSDQLL